MSGKQLEMLFSNSCHAIIATYSLP